MKQTIQILGEIGGLIFNLFFGFLLYKYFNTFNTIEKVLLMVFITLTFVIEPYLLSTWTKEDWRQLFATQ